jgi:hypothetical protein
LAIPVLRFCFGIFNLCQEELQKLDRKTTKLPTVHGQHYRKADIEHWYVTRKQGGRGLMQLEGAYAVEVIKLVEYIDRKEDPSI